MHSLPIFVRLHGRPVILLGEGEPAQAKRRLLERAGAKVVGEEAQASLAIVAIDDDADALAAIARLKARGILVNATDRADQCDFTLPAIIERDPVMIAIGTGGASAGLAKHVRQRIEALLPSSLGSLARALEAARTKMRARWGDASQRRRAIDAALAPGGPLDPLSGADAAAVDRWLTSAEDAPAGRYEILRLASTDPDELTLRAARLLGEADAVYHAPDVPVAILNRARADAARILAADPPSPDGAGLVLWIVMEPHA